MLDCAIKMLQVASICRFAQDDIGKVTATKKKQTADAVCLVVVKSSRICTN